MLDLLHAFGQLLGLDCPSVGAGLHVRRLTRDCGLKLRVRKSGVFCGDCAQHRRAAAFRDKPRLTRELGIELPGQDRQFGLDGNVGKLQERDAGRHMVAFPYKDLADDAAVAVLHDLGPAIDNDRCRGDDGSR